MSANLWSLIAILHPLHYIHFTSKLICIYLAMKELNYQTAVSIISRNRDIKHVKTCEIGIK